MLVDISYNSREQQWFQAILSSFRGQKYLSYCGPCGCCGGTETLVMLKELPAGVGRHQKKRLQSIMPKERAGRSGDMMSAER